MITRNILSLFISVVTRAEGEALATQLKIYVCEKCRHREEKKQYSHAKKSNDDRHMLSTGSVSIFHFMVQGRFLLHDGKKSSVKKSSSAVEQGPHQRLIPMGVESWFNMLTLLSRMSSYNVVTFVRCSSGVYLSQALYLGTFCHLKIILQCLLALMLAFGRPPTLFQLSSTDLVELCNSLYTCCITASK